MRDRKLYERCWLCKGTLATTAPAMVDGKAFTGRLPAGSTCPACSDPACKTPGFMEVGLTMDQVEGIAAQRDRLIVALDDVAQSDGPGHSARAHARLALDTLKPGAVAAARDRLATRDAKRSAAALPDDSIAWCPACKSRCFVLYGTCRGCAGPAEPLNGR